MVGAFAAQASGAPIPPTLDIDFTAPSSPENLRRIADALRELGARLRVASIAAGVPFDPAPQLIAQMAMLNLTCRYGDFDLAFHPSGTGGFEDLTERATTVLIGDTEARVAGLADVIRSKRAAARPKDLCVGRQKGEPANIKRSQGIRTRGRCGRPLVRCTSWQAGRHADRERAGTGEALRPSELPYFV